MEKQEIVVVEAKELQQQGRILSRVLARELTAEEVEAVSGGTTSCSGGQGDDCDRAQY